MKKFFTHLFCVIALICSMMSMTSCHLVTVDGTEEAVLNAKPWIFGKGGVYETPLTEGSEYCAASTEAIKFKIVPVQYDESFNDIMTNNNVPIDLTAHAIIQINRGKTPYLYSHFGEQWYENNLKKFFCKEVRNEISKSTMYDLTSNREVYDSIEAKIKDVMTEKIKAEKIPVTLLDVIVDRATPNKDALDEYNRTAVQLQKEQTEKAAAKMQDIREQSERKRAEADRAYMHTLGLNADQFIALRALEIEKEKLEMVKGKDKANVTMFMGNGSGVLPTYNVK